jgi:hypothetical protein
MCGPGRLGGETLDPPGGARSAICRIVGSSKATFKFDDVTAAKLLMRPLFSGCTSWPRLEKSRGKSARLMCPRLQ